MKALSPLAFVLVPVVVAACSSSSSSAPDNRPPMVCRAGGAAPTGRWFTDVTTEAGFGDVVGIRVAAADLNGDGFVDVVIHTPQATREKTIRVMMNDGHGHFVDRTAESGLADSRDGAGTGRWEHLMVFGDVDNDGDVDAFGGTYQDGTAKDPMLKDRSEIFLNDGKGHFTFAPSGPISKLPLPTSGASFLDYDRDGYLDLYVGTFYSPVDIDGAGNRLYQGNGDGTFEDASTRSHILREGAMNDTAKYLAGTYRRPAYGVTACDVDGDGLTDLLTSAYGRAYNELWKNGGDGTFTDVASPGGPDTTVASDDDVDYHDNEFYRCWCAANAGKCSAEESQPKVTCAGSAWNPGFDDQPARNGGNTFSTACGDLDNDGDMDLLHAEIRHWHIGQSSDPSEILRNDGGMKMTRLTQEETGLVRPHVISDWNEGDLDVGFFDADGDGKKDIYLSSTDYPETYGTLFHNEGNMKFTDVGETAGVRHYHAHGFGAVDIDNDGDLDLIVSTSTARCSGDPKCPPTMEVRVYRNDVGSQNNFVNVKLHGAPGKSNVGGIGARVTVKAGGITQVQELQGGYGHYGMQHGDTLTFGLGSACAIDEISVKWPDANGTVETFKDVRANYRIELRQGEKQPVYVLGTSAPK